jgi:hypothetical protein
MNRPAWFVGLAILASFALVVPVPKSAAYPGDGGGLSPRMGRLRTIGWEIQGLGGGSLEGAVTGTATIDTGFSRSGNNSLKCDSGAGNTTAFDSLTIPPAGDGFTVFARAYFYFNDLPTSQTVVVLSFATATKIVSARLTTGGKLQLWDDPHLLQLGSDSVASLVPGQWYRIELSWTPMALGTNESAALQLDGISVASVSNLSLGNLIATQVNCGWQTAPGANRVCHVDDFAVNSSSGTTQTTWPGEGKVVLLKPTGDSAVGTGWVDGDGAGTLFGSVDNTPPVGVATAADGTQIKNLTSTTTGNYDATMTTYAAAGLTPTDSITLAQGVWDTGTKAATSRAGAIQIVSNPAQAAEEAMTFGNGSAQGVWPSNWAGVWGTAQVNPSVTLTTAPVLRVGKRVANVAEVSVDFMGIYVEYVQGLPVSALHPFMDGPNTNTLLRM